MIKVLESTANWKKPEDGINIILTHADADGLVSAFQVRHMLKLRRYHNHGEDYPGHYIIISSLKAQPEETDRMLGTACKYLKTKIEDLTENDHIWILDRPTFTDEVAARIPKNVFYTACDHHESSLKRHQDIANLFTFSQTNLKDGIDNCGASLVSEYVKDFIYGIEEWRDPIYKTVTIKEINALSYIAQITNDWDTFRWKTLDPNDNRISKAMAIQACDKVLGEVLTWNELCRAWKDDDASRDDEAWFWDVFYNNAAKMASSIFEARLNDQKIMCDYSVGKNIRTCTLHGKAYRIAFMYGMEEFQSMLSQHIFETHPIVDAVIWMNFSGTISIRTSDETDIKANDLAIAIGEGNGFSGGGHPKAAGGRILDNDKLKKHLFSKVSKGLRHFGFEYVPELFGDE